MVVLKESPRNRIITHIFAKGLSPQRKNGSREQSAPIELREEDIERQHQSKEQGEN
jgi:hypothetical protein